MDPGPLTADSGARDLGQLAERLRDRSGRMGLVGLRGAASAAVLARLAQAQPGSPVLVLCGGAKETDRLVQDLRAVLGEPAAGEGGRVHPFPHPDTPPYDRFSPQPFVVAQRMDVLFRLASGDAPIVVAPWTALAVRVPGRDAVREKSLRVKRGGFLDRDELIASLIAAGYSRQPVVEERGEVAVRGGIVDVFPPHRARPVRIELLGDEVESLREFDPASQRSQGELTALVAPPARELLFDRDFIVERTSAIARLGAEQAVQRREVDGLVDTLLRGSPPPGMEAIAALLQPELETLFDFLPGDALVVACEPADGSERLVRHAGEAIENHEAAREAGRLVCPPDEIMLPADEILERLDARRPIDLERLGAESPGRTLGVSAAGHTELALALRSARSQAEPAETGPLSPLIRSLSAWCEAGYRVVVSVGSLSALERTRALLGEYAVESQPATEPEPLWDWSEPGAVEVRLADVSEGFVLPAERLAVVTEEEAFGPREKRRRVASWREGAALEALGQLSPGDALVHVEHGIGVYRGLVLLDLGRVRDEFLRLEYEDGDRLFVPVHRLNLIQRYVGSEGAPPRIDKLGGVTWEKTKRSVKRSMRNMARELLEVHAARETAPGYGFPPRDRALEEFEAAFPFEETPDQAAAIEDVLADMTRPQPMDRLVCGDVGYGKTEVAARAAFQAVMAGKQVAFLVPTTVLCQQHAETLTKRFADTPTTIETLSRFRSPKESREVLEGLASGRVDLVVGTHRLLQKNVEFRDLGLLVVDEEHRFGVAHKERIKQMKQTVDVLTLTATPIPRTLQMAFTGIRDLSVINTPPADRLAIRTQVCRFEESLIREAIVREVRRGGQVFFVHNRVRTIGALADLLGRLVPEVRVLVAHGQMKERELEDHMLGFMRGDYDVLLCTTIIESGLDIPRANTMLIDRADSLGLAQLYQLRGRVGRSSHRAYAYMLIPGEAGLTRDATQRLEAIQDLAELGSGFRLANMDLEIRGAGNLLGGEQSGNLGDVGYETYMELLDEAVEELRGGARPISIDPEIRLPLPARLPEEYVPDVSQRLVLYKRLAGAPDTSSLDQLRDELLDRYGALPRETDNLLGVIRLKVAARDLGVRKIEIERGELVLTAAETSRVDPQLLVQLATRPRDGVRVTPDGRLRAPTGDLEPEALFTSAHRVLDVLRGGAPPARG